MGVGFIPIVRKGEEVVRRGGVGAVVVVTARVAYAVLVDCPVDGGGVLGRELGPGFGGCNDMGDFFGFFSVGLTIS